MLNTPRTTVSSPPNGLFVPPRRCGGQLSNRNALRHGIFAEKNPTPLTHLTNAIRISTSGLDGIHEVLSQAIPVLRLQIARLMMSSQPATGLRSTLTRHRPIIYLLGLFLRVKKALVRIEQPKVQLRLVADHALELIRYDFVASGITRDAYSFREKNKLRYLNSFASSQDFHTPYSDLPSSFLSARQWAVLEPLIPPPDHVDPRGRPPADPRPLLDAIIWKFAYHARWQDLPPGSPPMLTCRRYYRRLFLSGRLLTLYSALYKDFLAHAKTDLSTLVNHDQFIVSGKILSLPPGSEETWQVRTALLFMQQGWQVFRRILREKEQERRHHSPQFR